MPLNRVTSVEEMQEVSELPPYFPSTLPKEFGTPTYSASRRPRAWFLRTDSTVSKEQTVTLHCREAQASDFKLGPESLTISGKRSLYVRHITGRSIGTLPVRKPTVPSNIYNIRQFIDACVVICEFIGFERDEAIRIATSIN
jgi:hypothetical protein